MTRRRSILRRVIIERRRALLGFMPLWFGRGDAFRRILNGESGAEEIWLQDGRLFGERVEREEMAN